MMAHWIKFLLFGLLCAAWLGQSRLQAQQIASFTLPNLQGQEVSLSDYQQQKAVVLVFLSANCPFVDSYEARIRALYQTYHDQGIAFLAINSNDSMVSPPDGTARLAQSAGLPFPYLKDANQQVTRALGATKNPQVFVLVPQNGHFQLVYQGAIDNFPLDASQAQHHYLRDALQAVHDGHPVPLTKTPAQGCSIRWANR